MITDICIPNIGGLKVIDRTQSQDPGQDHRSCPPAPVPLCSFIHIGLDRYFVSNYSTELFSRFNKTLSIYLHTVTNFENHQPSIYSQYWHDNRDSMIKSLVILLVLLLFTLSEVFT